MILPPSRNRFMRASTNKLIFLNTKGNIDAFAIASECAFTQSIATNGCVGSHRFACRTPVPVFYIATCCSSGSTCMHGPTGSSEMFPGTVRPNTAAVFYTKAYDEQQLSRWMGTGSISKPQTPQTENVRGCTILVAHGTQPKWHSFACGACGQWNGFSRTD